MIPIKDEQEHTTFAVATSTIIFITGIVFVLQVITGTDDNAIAYTFGFVPAKYTMTQMADYFSWLNKVSSPFTYMFLHGGFWHFIGNRSPSPGGLKRLFTGWWCLQVCNADPLCGSREWVNPCLVSRLVIFYCVLTLKMSFNLSR